MLIPKIFVFNISQFEFPLPATEEADLQKVEKEADLPEDEIVMVITDDVADFSKYGAKDKPRYFVYIGEEAIDKQYEESVISDSAMFPDGAELETFGRRWIRAIVRDYQARLYKTLLQTVIDTSPDMVWINDDQERHVILNKAFCEVSGKDYEFCLNKKYPEIWEISAEAYESSDFICRKNEQAVIQTGVTGIFEEPVYTRGQMKQFTTYRTAVYDSFGKARGSCGIAHDVTNFNNMGKELDIFLSAFPYPVFLCDKNFEIQRTNNMGERLFRGMQKLTNYKVWKDFFLNKENGSMMNDPNVYVLQEGANKYYYAVTEREIKDYFGNITGYFCLLRDVSYQRMYEELMFRAANVDPLTEAYNRRYFYELLEKQLSKPVTLLYMDLDNFKKVNDQYGHNKGDEILIETVRAIRLQFPGHQVVRLGGDEFALVISEYMEQGALQPRLDQISQKIETLADPSVHLGVSIGYGAVDKLTNVEEFINMCDDRMYEVKNQRHAAR